MTMRAQVTWTVSSAEYHLAFLREAAAGELGDICVLSTERIEEEAVA